MNDDDKPAESRGDFDTPSRSRYRCCSSCQKRLRYVSFDDLCPACERKPAERDDESPLKTTASTSFEDINLNSSDEDKGSEGSNAPEEGGRRVRRWRQRQPEQKETITPKKNPANNTTTPSKDPNLHMYGWFYNTQQAALREELDSTRHGAP